MTEDKYNRAKEMQETLILLKDKLDDFENLKTIGGVTINKYSKDILYEVYADSNDAPNKMYALNQICKDELITMINNIKTRLRAEINNLEAEFHEL